MSVGVVATNDQRPLILVDRVGGAIEPNERVAEIDVRVRVVGVELDRATIFRHRAREDRRSARRATPKFA